jgi:hypothetical protein
MLDLDHSQRAPFLDQFRKWRPDATSYLLKEDNDYVSIIKADGVADAD